MDPSLLHQHLKCILIRSTVFAWLPLVIVNRKFSCKLIFHHTVLIHSRKGKQCLKATRLRNQTKRLVLLISLCSVSVLWYLYHSMAPTRGYCDLSDWCFPLWLSHAVFLTLSYSLSFFQLLYTFWPINQQPHFYAVLRLVCLNKLWLWFVFFRHSVWFSTPMELAWFSVVGSYQTFDYLCKCPRWWERHHLWPQQNAQHCPLKLTAPPLPCTWARDHTSTTNLYCSVI